jgi:hypothetical protein
MSDHNKSHKHERQSPPAVNNNSRESDDDDHESDKWNPTPQVFEWFLTRDFELAQNNIQQAMLSRGAPMTTKELKDSTLHSADVIERVLASKIASGLVTEAKGKYSLVRA